MPVCSSASFRGIYTVCHCPSSHKSTWHTDSLAALPGPEGLIDRLCQQSDPQQLSMSAPCRNGAKQLYCTQVSERKYMLRFLPPCEREKEKKQEQKTEIRWDGGKSYCSEQQHFRRSSSKSTLCLCWAWVHPREASVPPQSCFSCAKSWASDNVVTWVTEWAQPRASGSSAGHKFGRATVALLVGPAACGAGHTFWLPSWLSASAMQMCPLSLGIAQIRAVHIICKQGKMWSREKDLSSILKNLWGVTDVGGKRGAALVCSPSDIHSFHVTSGSKRCK